MRGGLFDDTFGSSSSSGEDSGDDLPELEGGARKGSTEWYTRRANWKVYDDAGQDVSSVRECCHFILNEKRQGNLTDSVANRLCKFIHGRLLRPGNDFPRFASRLY
jgi:DNA phosphorothioation-dependent restriction protein DptG